MLCQAGQESYVASRPQAISWKNSAGLNLCWSWGSQLKLPPPWEWCLLAPKQPLQCTMDPEGITLHGPSVYEALGVVRLKPFLVCSGKFHTISEPRKPTCPQALLSPSNQRWTWKSVALLWTFSVTTTWSPLLTDTSIHKAWGSDNDSCPQEISYDRHLRNKFPTHLTFRKPTAKG